ncbi:hypothetical protein K470DRAFT_268644 [Piedraia hortae CBS 480.64]|uniref:Uncharacterized protein n=1 Tax=Piedraia hortae CBS 480.64 TaxID=1314780 RepID=A0A6A7C602_9PEZI|nr:hypothetical protein K470DRAFT_268644 [Piedraia hortae CBS 480.64]
MQAAEKDLTSFSRSVPFQKLKGQTQERYGTVLRYIRLRIWQPMTQCTFFRGALSYGRSDHIIKQRTASKYACATLKTMRLTKKVAKKRAAQQDRTLRILWNAKRLHWTQDEMVFYWGAAKKYFRDDCDYSTRNLLENVRDALSSVSGSTIHKFFQRICRTFTVYHEVYIYVSKVFSPLASTRF